MVKNIEHIQHIKSNVVINGGPKLPNPSALTEGEIAINYAEGVETLSIKNESGDVVTFSSDNYYTEKKLGSGFTGENSGVTVTEALENVEITVDQVIDSGTSASTNAVATKAVYDAITDNELVWTNAYVALSGAVSSHTANTIIHVTQADRDRWDNGTGGGGFSAITNPSDSTKVGLVNKLSEYYDTNIGKGAVIEGSGTASYRIEASGDYSHAEGNATTASSESSHAEGDSTEANGYYSHAEGSGAFASGDYSHAEGESTVASGESSHAEGHRTEANGDYSHTEGCETIASGQSSHAEGTGTIASGSSSHAEGELTQANGDYSHAEGHTTNANGDYSHAEGNRTTAKGSDSHAEGYHTFANNNSEHASGQYNISSSASTEFGNSGNTLFSVGNGTADNARHNAFEIMQNGDIYITSGNSTILLQDNIGADLSNYYTKQNIDDKLGTGFSVSSVTEVIESNERVTATALNSLNTKVGSGFSSSSITEVIKENELVTSEALNDLDGRIGSGFSVSSVTEVMESKADKEEDLDGVKLKKITQSEYDALEQAGTLDPNTLYIITDNNS